MNKTELKLGQIITSGNARFEVIDEEAANKEVERWKDYIDPGYWLKLLRIMPEKLQTMRGFKELEPTREELEEAGQMGLGFGKE